VIWIAGIVAALLLSAVVIYNRLVALRRLVQNAWADVDVYLKRRAELIPNLVEAVKGAATYERTTLEALAEARSHALAAPGPSEERARAERDVREGMHRVLLLAEAYPTLTASQNFLQLQGDLRETEKLIARARQYYNACVRDYNTAVESFPAALLAGSLGFRPREPFEVEAVSERDAAKVEL
jgi:LemA protein